MGVRERREKVSQRWREREGKGESEKEREREGGIATPSYLCQFAEKKKTFCRPLQKQEFLDIFLRISRRYFF